MIGENGEKITESHEFYPVFATEREYRIVHETRTLGSYPLDSPLVPGETLIFAGRRWKVLEIDDAARIITVRPSRGGKPPYFSGQGGSIHDHIVSTMRRILGSRETYPYVDRTASRMLESARDAFIELGLDRRSIIGFGDGVLVFPWVGTRKLSTLSVAFQAKDFQTTQLAHAIELQGCDVEGVEEFVRGLANGAGPNEAELVARVSKPNVARFDHFLSWDLISLVTIRERLEIGSLPSIAAAASR
ncbi:hypothetical protein [Sinorhizobium sp. 22678]|uniref:hypothetical protein n=1 Tax=Sinorhizobium sp. 22678 TaxID=3453955 RepID=UPI003F877099